MRSRTTETIAPVSSSRVEPDATPPLLVDASGGEAADRGELLVHLREESIWLEERSIHFVEERHRGLLPRLRPGERRREARNGGSFAPALARNLFGLANSPARADEQRAIAPDEHDDPGHGHRGGADEDEPRRLVGQRVAFRQGGRERRRDRGDDGEEEPDREPEPRRPTLPEEREAEQEDREKAGRRPARIRAGRRVGALAEGRHPAGVLR